MGLFVCGLRLVSKTDLSFIDSKWVSLFISAQIIIELNFVNLHMAVMRKWFKKNENKLIKLGAIGFVLNFTGLFIIDNNILPIIIVIWLLYSIYKQGGLFND